MRGGEEEKELHYQRFIHKECAPLISHVLLWGLKATRKEALNCTLPSLQALHLFIRIDLNMSDKCGNCDCFDKSQCVKKGNRLDIVETERSYVTAVVMEGPAENDGKCKCGASCSCTNCTCGSH